MIFFLVYERQFFEILTWPQIAMKTPENHFLPHSNEVLTFYSQLSLPPLLWLVNVKCIVGYFTEVFTGCVHGKMDRARTDPGMLTATQVQARV